MDNNNILDNYFNDFIPISSDTSTVAPYYILGAGNGITPNGTKVNMKKESKMPTKIFFSLMKKKMGILKDYSYKKRISALEKAVAEAEKNGQIAFSEELLKKLLVLCREAEIFGAGRKIFLSRELFDKFRNKTERPVSLTPLKNYARPIPKEVLEEKNKCDNLNLFDGYAIIHYDSKEAVKETFKEEKERREKDPILFGIVRDSDKLYFISDWSDEWCDLTLDDIIDKLDLEDKDVTFPKNIKL
jgi:hypothetical protein